MATVANNDVVEGFSGKFGNDLVFRTMRGKTFVSPPPRKTNKKKESEAQRNTRVNFRNAADWAQITLLNPERKAYYQQRAKALKLPNAYTAAVTDYMRKAKIVKSQHRDTITYRIYKPGFTIQEVKATCNDSSTAEPKVVIRKQNERWFVHYTPDEAEHSLTLILTDNSLRDVQFVDVLKE